MKRIVAKPECFPDSVIERIQALADAHPEAEVVLVGGLSWNMHRDPGESDEDFEARAALFRPAQCQRSSTFGSAAPNVRDR